MALIFKTLESFTSIPLFEFFGFEVEKRRKSCAVPNTTTSNLLFRLCLRRQQYIFNYQYVPLVIGTECHRIEKLHLQTSITHFVIYTSSIVFAKFSSDHFFKSEIKYAYITFEILMVQIKWLAFSVKLEI